MGLKNLQIVFDNQQGIYFGGQTVSGRLLVELDKPKNVRSIRIKLKGEAYVHWTESRRERRNGKSHTRLIHYNGQETYFENTINVFGGSDSSTLPPGEHSYPFSMILPYNLPSSFEGDHGYIRYTVKGTLDRPWKFDHDVKEAFTVLSHVNLNEDHRNREPWKHETSKTFCCCCCRSGPLTMVTLLPARGFVPGQGIPVTVEVDNASNVEIYEVKIELQKIESFHADSPRRKTKEHHVTVKEEGLEGSVKENNSKTWATTFTLPSLPPSQLRECHIIDLEYRLKVRAKPVGMHSELVHRIPLTIGTIPLWEGQPMPTTAAMPMPMLMPSAPPADMAGPSYPNMLPPTYEECMYGTTNIHDDGDKHTFGNTSYNPCYPMYQLPPPLPGWAAPPPADPPQKQ